MKFAFYTLILATLFSSCKKTTTTSATQHVSGKIKSIVNSELGSRQAFFQELDYDASGRLFAIKKRTEDSSFTPIKITEVYSTMFYYNGAEDKPFKDSVYSPTNASLIQKNLFYYDAQNRHIKTERFGRTGLAENMETYSYGISMLIRNVYRPTFPGSGVYNLEYIDTVSFDSELRASVIKSRLSFIPLPQTENFTYDTKSNPLALLNVSKYLVSYHAGGFLFLDSRAANNVLMRTVQYAFAASSNQVITTTYNYSANNFPINANVVKVDSPPGRPSATYYTAVRYEYY